MYTYAKNSSCSVTTKNGNKEYSKRFWWTSKKYVKAHDLFLVYDVGKLA